LKYKLDENFGTTIKKLFLEEKLDVETILDEKLSGEDDEVIYKICCKENKCLVTLDLDFSNIIKYSPNKCNGIVIFRSSKNNSLEILKELIRQFLEAIKKENPSKKLWIVEINRIRIHDEINL